MHKVSFAALLLTLAASSGQAQPSGDLRCDTSRFTDQQYANRQWLEATYCTTLKFVDLLDERAQSWERHPELPDSEAQAANNRRNSRECEEVAKTLLGRLEADHGLAGAQAADCSKINN